MSRAHGSDSGRIGDPGDVLVSKEFLADPYPFYERFRSEMPVAWSERLGAWIVVRHEDVATGLKDPRLVSGGRVAAIMSRIPLDVRVEVSLLEEHLNGWIAFTDPPFHTRLRRLAAPAFTGRRASELRFEIQRAVDELVDDMLEQDQPDVIRDLAFPLPAGVIARMIGVPNSDHELFGRWSSDIAAVISSADADPSAVRRARASIEDLSAYFVRLVEDRQRVPRDDLLSTLLASDQGGDRLSEAETFSMFVQLYFAGHETTAGLVGNGLLALLRNPAELAKLKDQPDLIGSAVEEFLRFDSPIQRQARVASEDVQIGSEVIRQGDYVLFFIGSANRDPDVVEDPDRLDITRDQRHLSFGVGIHFCLGAALARVEAQVAISTLLARVPDIALASTAIEWEPLLAIRKLRSLPVECSLP